jgi:hypothetical protein
MADLPTLTLRREELVRRIQLLPKEVDDWRARATTQVDMDVHFSQLDAIKVLTDAVVASQQTLAAGLDATGDAETFRMTAIQLVDRIIKGQRAWDFFRDKLELRFSPDFKDVLWVSDTIAWDCYRPVMDRAVQAGIVPAAEVREPPLTYLTAEFSPATWVRGSRPNDGIDHDLGTALLPIPVIEIPWDHLGNLWELVSLQHEVGHDLEADVHLRPVLRASLQQALAAKGVPQERINVWTGWEGEVFADLVGLQLGGPAFALGLLHLLLLPAQMVTTFDKDDPHPTHYTRILLNAAHIRTLIANNAAMQADAAAIESIWTGQYTKPAALQPFEGDFATVIQALMDTKFPILKNKSVRELMPYTAADDARIHAAAAFLRTGQNAPGKQTMAPRHGASAARIAAAEAVNASLAGGGGGAAALATALGTVNANLIQLVRDQALPGLRAGDISTPHKKFVAGFEAFL